MAKAEFDASNWRRTDERHWRMLWDHEIGELPTHRESRFWLASGLLLPVWDRLPAGNMRVRRLSVDTGEALIGRVLDAEQVHAVRTSFGLDGGPAMTGAEAIEAVMESGNALALANGWRLARRRVMGGSPGRDRGAGGHPLARPQAHGLHRRDHLLAHPRVRARCGHDRAHPRPMAARRLSFRNDNLAPPPSGIHIAGRAAAGTAASREDPMTAQTLPDNPNFCFVPAYDVEDEVQQIRIVIEGMAGHVPTALVALTIEDALLICDKLNRRLGYDRDAWTAMAAASMHAEDDDPDGGAWH